MSIQLQHFSALRFFRPKRPKYNFQDSTADGGWRGFVYPG